MKKYSMGKYELDPGSHSLCCDSTPVPLSRKRFQVLLFLIEERHRLVTREDLIERFWGGQEVYEENLTKCISEIRKALDDQQKPHRYIETHPAVGYRYIGQAEEAAEKEEKNVTLVPPVVPVVTQEPIQPLAAPVARASLAKRLRTPQFLIPMLALLAFALAVFTIYPRRSDSNLAATPHPAIRSLAILPFKPISDQNRDQFLELGMADALITKLSNLREVVVASTGSVRKYASLMQDPIAAGHELKVESVLEGTIQKLDQRIRVRVRLIRVADGSPLWAETFDEDLADVFTLQDSISEKVAYALEGQLSTQSRAQITKRYTENNEAYRSYMKGRYFWEKRTEHGLKKSIEFFERAVNKDPNYALAYAGLAGSYIAAGANFNVFPPKTAYPKAKQAALKALEIDNGLSEPHAALAFATMLFDWDWPAAEREFRRAIELNPNYGVAHLWYAASLVSAGRMNEAMAEVKRAQEAEPLSLPINAGVGWIAYLNRNYDKAIEESNTTIEMDPGFAPAYLYRGMAYEQKGMLDKAIDDLETARGSHRRPAVLGALGHAYAVAGMRTKAESLLRELKETSRTDYFQSFQLALIYIGLGEKDEAFAMLEKAYDERYSWLIHLHAEPRLDPIRSDPRFVRLARRTGLPMP